MHILQLHSIERDQEVVALLSTNEASSVTRPSAVSNSSWAMVQTFLRLLRRPDHPRVVNTASGAGSHGDTQSG